MSPSSFSLEPLPPPNTYATESIFTILIMLVLMDGGINKLDGLTDTP